MDQLPDDYFVTSMQFTKHAHRDVYPAIDPSSPALSQAGKVIVITGASRGLGAKAFVPSFAKAGAKAIVLVARDPNRLKKSEAEFKSAYPNTRFLSIACDVSDPKSVAQLFQEIKSTFGHANVLVNNAGVLQAQGTVKDVDAAEWWKELTLNSYGTFLVTQQFLRSIPADSQSTVISLTTGAAYQVYPGLSAYGISKLVVLQLTAFVAAENPNVAAFALHPGVVPTDMLVDSFARFALDTPELVGGTAVWLATGKARFLSGRFINSNWSMEDLLERREEIEKSDILKVNLQGTFGTEQFQT